MALRGPTDKIWNDVSGNVQENDVIAEWNGRHPEAAELSEFQLRAAKNNASVQIQAAVTHGPTRPWPYCL